ncbi:MAG: VWA domain-containing protein [Vicinamibacteria bacterium]
MTALVLAVLLAPAAAQKAPVFASEVGAVRVEVSVTRNGEPVRGLTAADFELVDAGRRQELQLVVEERARVDAVLVVDLSMSVRGAKHAAVRGGAAAFLDGLREGESAALVGFRDEVLLLSDFTTDRARIFDALGAAEPRGSTALQDAVYAALRLRPPGGNRLAVVVFSDGVDNVSVLPAADVVAAAARTPCVVYGVGVRQKSDARQSFLQDVVKATGGRYFEALSDRELNRRFLDVLADIRSRYVLSFTPTDASAPGFHELAVRLPRVKADVLARTGYWR